MKKGIQIVALAVLVTAEMAYAQQPIDSSDSEVIFRAALDAFESEDYMGAYHSFRDIYEHEPVQKKTTAAYLMAGKSLYRLGEYISAIQLMEEFQSRYPNSRYMEDAAHLAAVSMQDFQYAEWDENAIRLGLALPLSSNDLTTTWSVFSGVQIAVDAYNRKNEQKVKIIFRDTSDGLEGARFAASSLVDEGVSAIIGPLYSERVHSASLVTEQSKTVLIAPLATDRRLTDSRRYVFQANATLSERGRSIAHQSIEYLSLEAIGILEDAHSYKSKEMTRGLIEELAANGLTPSFRYEIESSFDWSRLPQLVGRDTLWTVEGIFLSLDPDYEVEASRIVQNVVSGLYNSGLRPHILGPSSWNSLNVGRIGAGIKIYYVDVNYQGIRMDTRMFIREYRDAHDGVEPDRYASIGYDIAGLLLENLGKGGSVAEHLMNAPLYEGVGMRIQFGERRHNTALYLFEHTPNGPQLVR